MDRPPCAGGEDDAGEEELDEGRDPEESPGDSHLLDHLGLHHATEKLAGALVTDLIRVESEGAEQEAALEKRPCTEGEQAPGVDDYEPERDQRQEDQAPCDEPPPVETAMKGALSEKPPREDPQEEVEGVGRQHGPQQSRKPGLAGMEGPVLGFDIDVVITGPLDDLFDFAPGKVCMRRDWLEARRRRPGGHGSVFRYDPALHGYLYHKFAADPDGCALESNGSEQKYTSITALTRGDLEYFPPRWIASFKRNAIPIPPLNFFFEPRLPRDTRVMCFHGRPKIEEATEGYREEWFHAALPARWLENYWRGKGQ